MQPRPASRNRSARIFSDGRVCDACRRFLSAHKHTHAQVHQKPRLQNPCRRSYFDCGTMLNLPDDLWRLVGPHGLLAITLINYSLGKPLTQATQEDSGELPSRWRLLAGRSSHVSLVSLNSNHPDTGARALTLH